MSYMTIKEASEKWGLMEHAVLGLLEYGFIKGALYDLDWKIPVDYELPELGKGGSFFPSLHQTNVLENPFQLNKDELALLFAQLLELKLEYKKTIELCEIILKETPYSNVKHGCYATICQCAMATGNLYTFRLYLDKLQKINASNKYENKEKELLLCKIYSNLYFQDTIDWMMGGDLDNLSASALPSARILYIFNQIKNAETVAMCNFRILLSETRIEGAKISEAYILLLMASAYHYMGNIDKSIEFINIALDILLPYGYLEPLLSLRKSIGVILDQEIKARNERLYKEYVNAHKEFMENWDKIYAYYKGDYPTKDLNLREEEIMFYVINGKSNQEIADILCLSIETIKTNLKAIFQKTGVNKRNELKDYMEEHY